MSESELIDGVLKGNRRALARLITLIEDEDLLASKVLAKLYKHTGKAHIIGITGPPGSGKSTIVTKLIPELRKKQKTIGIVCVDPSSPFSGGALLGDRIRMQEHTLDEAVYVRSMGTRGHLGGLARSTSDAVRAIDAFGKDVIIVETVGAGQAEVEIIEIAQTVIVTDVPGSGDDIQAIKAGIMEIADIFVVNKSDLPGADNKVMEINAMLELDSRQRDWTPPVILTDARSGDGIPELVEKIEQHIEFLKKSGLLNQKDLKRSRDELEDLMRDKLTRKLLEKLRDEPEYDNAIAKIAKRNEDPYTVAERLIAEFLVKYRE
ncbi:MAG: methylmalonyl Co-A mutase-associated GTPase MeaB [Candidatus Thorarchaeota archaeon SMTZ1-83]|nr:MAG: GTPase [Candidatus Thorarchaeota archaeon SMTZ1-83]